MSEIEREQRENSFNPNYFLEDNSIAVELLPVRLSEHGFIVLHCLRELQVDRSVSGQLSELNLT